MEFKERLAKALYEGFFDHEWEHLLVGGIERAMWMGLAQKAIEMCEAEKPCSETIWPHVCAGGHPISESEITPPWAHRS